MIERRTLLKGSLATLAVLSGSPGRLFGALPEAEAFSRARFEALKGTWFEVEAGGVQARVRLIEVHPCNATPELEQYSLVMHGPGAEIGEGIHRVTPADGMPFEMHLRPLDSSSEPSFTASFSHRRPARG